MLVLLWLMLAAFLLVGFIGLSILGFGALISLLINLVLLPLRIFIWILRALLGLF